HLFFFQAEDGIRDKLVTGVQTCALPICLAKVRRQKAHDRHEELGREVGSEEERRGEDPEAMLHAMDVEGIDVSIVFRTRAAHVRSEERRVGKEWRSGGSAFRYNRITHIN